MAEKVRKNSLVLKLVDPSKGVWRVDADRRHALPGVEFDSKVLMDLLSEHFPSARRAGKVRDLPPLDFTGWDVIYHPASNLAVVRKRYEEKQVILPVLIGAHKVTDTWRLLWGPFVDRVDDQTVYYDGATCAVVWMRVTLPARTWEAEWHMEGGGPDAGVRRASLKVDWNDHFAGGNHNMGRVCWGSMLERFANNPTPNPDAYDRVFFSTAFSTHWQHYWKWSWDLDAAMAAHVARKGGKGVNHTTWQLMMPSLTDPTYLSAAWMSASKTAGLFAAI